VEWEEEREGGEVKWRNGRKSLGEWRREEGGFRGMGEASQTGGCQRTRRFEISFEL
jgi:hypothetical protein